MVGSIEGRNKGTAVYCLASQPTGEGEKSHGVCNPLVLSRCKSELVRSLSALQTDHRCTMSRVISRVISRALQLVICKGSLKNIWLEVQKRCTVLCQQSAMATLLHQTLPTHVSVQASVVLNLPRPLPVQSTSLGTQQLDLATALRAVIP